MPGAERTADVAALHPLFKETFHYPSPRYGPRFTNPILLWAEWKLRYFYPLSPVEMQFARSRDGATLIRQLHPEQYDLVWVERLRMMPLVPLPTPARVVVDLDDIESGILAARLRKRQSYRGVLFDYLEYLKWRRLEKGLHKLGHTFVVCSEADKRLIGGGPRVQVIPNGIDLPEDDDALGQQTPQPRFMFLGTMSYSANIDAVLYFIECMWPRILDEVPSAQFLIVGQDPDPAIQRLHDGKRIVVTGTVPETAPYFRQAVGMVVPLRFGSGTRIKILEAWSRRLPVVSTRLGAEGLDAEDGKHLLIADSAEEFALSCVRMFRDFELRQRLSLQGYDHVRQHFTWDIIENTVGQLMEGRSSETVLSGVAG